MSFRKARRIFVGSKTCSLVCKALYCVNCFFYTKLACFCLKFAHMHSQDSLVCSYPNVKHYLLCTCIEYHFVKHPVPLTRFKLLIPFRQSSIQMIQLE